MTATAHRAPGRTDRHYLMCEPVHYTVSYEINPWMHKDQPTETALAVQQWRRLRDTYLELGHTVELIDPIPGLPDMVYAANGATVVDGIVYSARMNAAQPNAGDGVELDAIAACFIGGASTTGGIGRIGGAMIGGMIMAVMSNIMQLMGWPQPTQKVARGLVLLLAVAFDLWNRRRSEAAA